jgi:perosamine synthetase
VIPVNTPQILEEDIQSVVQSLRDGWISGEGPVVSSFEDAFAKLCGRKYAVAVSNGTAAIDLVIHALGLGPGDEIILPSFTIISCVSQILRTGARPIFVDSDPNTWNMDVSLVEPLINQRTRAIMAVHTYGLPVDMDPLIELAARYAVPIIEDAAESHGLKYKDKICGSFGIVSTFSFYANKHLTTGEGGMVLTDNEELVESLRRFRNLAFRPEKRFVHHDIGWNLRMSSMQCALGMSQLKRLDSILEKRRRLGAYYSQAFKEIPEVQLPVSDTAYSANNYWVFGIVLEGRWKGQAELVQDKLNHKGIGTRPFFWPLHEQPVLKKFGFEKQPNLPVSANLARSGFYIPNGLGMSDDDAEEVIKQVRAVLS